MSSLGSNADKSIDYALGELIRVIEARDYKAAYPRAKYLHLLLYYGAIMQDRGVGEIMKVILPDDKD